jgi:hypothetical protein
MPADVGGGPIFPSGTTRDVSDLTFFYLFSFWAELLHKRDNGPLYFSRFNLIV